MSLFPSNFKRVGLPLDEDPYIKSKSLSLSISPNFSIGFSFPLMDLSTIPP